MENDQIQYLQECLKKMKLSAMALALENFKDNSYVAQKTVVQHVYDIIMAEYDKRNNTRIGRYLKESHIRYNGAAFNEEMLREGSGITENMIEELKRLQFVSDGKNILITGPAGTGKSYLASAIGIRAITEDFSALYERTSLFLNDIHAQEMSGTLSKRLKEVSEPDLLILDDFGMNRLDLNNCRSLYEVLETRVSAKKPVIIISQKEVSEWYGLFEDVVYAESCMDRLMDNPIRINLKGDSLRVHKPAGGSQNG